MGRVETEEVNRRVEEFMKAARSAGVKVTHQRLEIFREVASSLEHPDAEAVYRAVSVKMPTVSLDTVYRTLWMLNDMGLIKTLGPRRESVRFDANTGSHHHYVCVKCGLVRDFSNPVLAGLTVPDEVKSYGTIVTTHVEVRGICERCTRDEARKRQGHPSEVEDLE